MVLLSIISCSSWLKEIQILKCILTDAVAMNLLFESDENESDFEIDEEFSDLSSDDSDQEAFDSGSKRQKRDHDISESDYSDNEVDSSDPREYINVSANDSEPSKIQFSGTKSGWPHHSV